MNENGMMKAPVPIPDYPSMNEHQPMFQREDFSKSSKTQLLKRWSIGIEFFDSGCIVRVGCKTIAFDTVEEALAEIEEYCKDPHAAIKEWSKFIEI